MMEPKKFYATPYSIQCPFDERLESSLVVKCWDDFDHSQTLHFPGSTTDIVYERNHDDHILQRCKKQEWSSCRAKLIEITHAEKKNELFIATRFMFSYRDYVYVGSDIADICLADIIYCTIPMIDHHVSAISKQASFESHSLRLILIIQVVQGLLQIELEGMEYRGLKASNVFISPDGTVKLGKYYAMIG